MPQIGLHGVPEHPCAVRHRYPQRYQHVAVKAHTECMVVRHRQVQAFHKPPETWVFYLYDRKPGQKKVPYSEYTRFPILGYMFTHIADEEDDLKRFRNDWEITREYLIKAAATDNPEELYPKLHSSIKRYLFYVDIAPRFKKGNRELGEPSQAPRFRIKKSYVNSVFQRFWNRRQNKASSLEHLAKQYTSLSDLEADLHCLTETYKGKTVAELIKLFDIILPPSEKVNKAITEQIAVESVRWCCTGVL